VFAFFFFALIVTPSYSHFSAFRRQNCGRRSIDAIITLSFITPPLPFLRYSFRRRLRRRLRLSFFVSLLQLAASITPLLRFFFAVIVRVHYALFVIFFFITPILRRIHARFHHTLSSPFFFFFYAFAFTRCRRRHALYADMLLIFSFCFYKVFRAAAAALIFHTAYVAALFRHAMLLFAMLPPAPLHALMLTYMILLSYACFIITLSLRHLHIRRHAMPCRCHHILPIFTLIFTLITLICRCCHADLMLLPLFHAAFSLPFAAFDGCRFFFAFADAAVIFALMFSLRYARLPLSFAADMLPYALLRAPSLSLIRASVPDAGLLIEAQ